MRILKTIILLASGFCASAKELVFTSGEKQTTMIELFTSEGCSSCPRADKWLSKLKQSDDLWSKYIPMAFHVDYWDYIGWDDVFADHTYSQRQRKHQKQGNIKSVYTPAFVVNGREWRGFFKMSSDLPKAINKPGVLTATIKDDQVLVDYDNAMVELTYHVAILGVGLNTEIKRGENEGKTLPHDFVVLKHLSTNAQKTAVFDLPSITKHKPDKYGIAIWVSSISSQIPLQATGGYLPQEPEIVLNMLVN